MMFLIVYPLPQLQMNYKWLNEAYSPLRVFPAFGSYHMKGRGTFST